MQYFLRARGLPTSQEVIEAVMALAKKSERLLTEEEILEVVRSVAGVD